MSEVRLRPDERRHVRVTRVVDVRVEDLLEDRVDLPGIEQLEAAPDGGQGVGLAHGAIMPRPCNAYASGESVVHPTTEER
jgi:hypothetical protein